MTKRKTARKTKQKFRWGVSRFPVPAQEVGEWITSRFGQNKPPTSELLEIIADEPDCPAYRCLEWDDAKAGHQYRLIQVRKMCASLVSVSIEEGKEVERFVLVHVTDAEGPRYVDAECLATNDDLKASAIREVLGHLDGLQRRYNFIAELKPLFDAAAKVKSTCGLA